MTNSELDNTENHNEEPQDDFTSVKHSVKHKQTERKIRKKRKKVNRVKSFLRFVVLVLLTFFIYKFFDLSGWYLKPDTFSNPDVKTVQVINNNIVPEKEIYSELKEIKVSRLPIFLVKVKSIQKILYKNPVIKNVYIRRYGFPARFQIIINERTPIAIIKTELNAKPTAFFTLDGVLIMNKPYMNLSEYKDVLKILTKSNKLSEDLSVERVHYIEKIVKAVEDYSNEKVEYIDMRNPNDVYVKIKTTSVRLGTLDSTVFQRIKRLYTILPQVSKVSQVKYIDLSWDKVNYFKLNERKK